jgi:hypothetical protein
MSCPAVLAEFPSERSVNRNTVTIRMIPDAVRYLGNEVPDAQGLLNVVLFLSAPSLTPWVWLPENHLDQPTTAATLRLQNICRYLSATITSSKLSRPLKGRCNARASFVR